MDEKRYQGTRYKLEVKNATNAQVGVVFEPFEIGFVDGLARAQMLHAYVSLLNEEEIAYGDESLWTSDPDVTGMLSSMQVISVNYLHFASLADSFHETLRARSTAQARGNVAMYCSVASQTLRDTVACHGKVFILRSPRSKNQAYLML